MRVMVTLYAAGRRPAFIAALVTALAITVSACQPPAQTPTPTSLPPAVPSPAGSATTGPAISNPETPTPDAVSPSASPAATPVASSTDVPEGVKVGQRAPDFALPSLDGNQIHLSDLRGKVVLLNFWASWCPPCREEMPALNDLYQKRRDQGFVVLAVNSGEDPNTAQAFVKKGGYTFPVVLDRNSDVGFTYQAVAPPTSYLIDAQGIVRDRIVGGMTAEIMQAKVDRFVGSGTETPPQPRSVVEAAGAANEQVAAVLDGQKITMREVNHRVDVLLALDQLDSGAVLDPLRSADQAELKQRQQYALDDLINGRLLADAARAANLKPDSTSVEHALVTLASEAGGSDALAAELAKHGVTIDDVRALAEEQSLAGTYADQTIAPNADSTTIQNKVGKWLDAERARRGVKVLPTG